MFYGWIQTDNADLRYARVVWKCLSGPVKKTVTFLAQKNAERFLLKHQTSRVSRFLNLFLNMLNWSLSFPAGGSGSKGSKGSTIGAKSAVLFSARKDGGELHVTAYPQQPRAMRKMPLKIGVCLKIGDFHHLQWPNLFHLISIEKMMIMQ
jgi:hypothetical protein